MSTHTHTHTHIHIHTYIFCFRSKSVCLVVDDEPNNIKLVRRVLQKCNFDAVSCEDGCDVLETLKENNWQVDVILMDQMMKQVCGRKTGMMKLVCIPTVSKSA